MSRFGFATIFALAAGVATAEPAMTVDETTMRAAPTAHALVLQEIPARAQVDLGKCGDRWCAVSWREIDGFVRVEAVAPNDIPLSAAPRLGPYNGGPVAVGPVFGFGYYYRRQW